MEDDLFIKILLSVLGFVGVLSVNQLIIIAKAINEIKTEFKVMNYKHDNLETRVQNLETSNKK